MMTFQIFFFSFFSRSILARTCNDTEWHHQQTYHQRHRRYHLYGQKCSYFCTCLTVKVVVVPFIHPALRLRFLHVDYHHMHLLPSKRTFRLFLATNNIYLLASQVTKDRLRVRKTKRKLNEILLKILYYNEWLYWATV